jgi:hypothetical protein
MTSSKLTLMYIFEPATKHDSSRISGLARSESQRLLSLRNLRPVISYQMKPCITTEDQNDYEQDLYLILILSGDMSTSSRNKHAEQEQIACVVSFPYPSCKTPLMRPHAMHKYYQPIP